MAKQDTKKNEPAKEKAPVRAHDKIAKIVDPEPKNEDLYPDVVKGKIDFEALEKKVGFDKPKDPVLLPPAHEVNDLLKKYKSGNEAAAEEILRIVRFAKTDNHVDNYRIVNLNNDYYNIKSRM